MSLIIIISTIITFIWNLELFHRTWIFMVKKNRVLFEVLKIFQDIQLHKKQYTFKQQLSLSLSNYAS